MIETLPSSRVIRLRRQYMDCAMLTEYVSETKYLSYSRERRQRLHFMQGWLKYDSVFAIRLRRAYAEAYILDTMQPVINDDELIVGCPDFRQLSGEEQAFHDTLIQTVGKFVHTRGRTDHMSLDYEKLLKVGVRGLIKEINIRREALDLNNPDNLSKDEFYEGCLIELNATLALAVRYAEYARSLASQAEPQRKEELLEIARILDNVPAKPAQTFREALQSIHFYTFTLWGLYYQGRIDQYLLSYYELDLAEGRITDDQAQELFDCYCLLSTTYITPNSLIGFIVGGRNRQGELVDNAITRMAMQSIAHVPMANPAVALSVTQETDDDLLRFAIKLLSRGSTKPALFNDELITSSLVKYGFPVEDARDYMPTGCVEITPCARSGIWVVSPYHNMVNMLLEALHEEPEPSSLDEIIVRFTKILRREIFTKNLQENRWQLERSRNGANVLRVSCLTRDCLERGKSVDEGGAIYNQIQPCFLGMANVVDSLAAIEILVFQKKKCRINDLLDILDINYEGYEQFRAYLINKLPHFGTNEDLTDNMAKRVAALIVDCCQGINTYHGSFLVPSTFSYIEHGRHGLQTPATPDGRLKGYPLAAGSSPVQGRETAGPTAAILSSTAWDHSPYIGGVAVNLKFSLNQMVGESEDRMLALIRTFMQRGGFELQINAVNVETLKKAQENPEAYRDLIVRVGGFSAFFVQLTPQVMQEIIDRNEHGF